MSEQRAGRRALADEEERNAPHGQRRHFFLLDEPPLKITAIEEVRESPFARALSRLAAHWPQVERWGRRRAGSSDSLSATEEAVD